MKVKGWKYLKLGECPECSESGTKLFVPVLSGTPVDFKGLDLVSGDHIPHFRPICKRCCKQYTLENICITHRLPIKVSIEECDLCLKDKATKSISEPDKGGCVNIQALLNRRRQS